MRREELTIIAAVLKDPVQFGNLLALHPTDEAFTEPDVGRLWTACKVANDKGLGITFASLGQLVRDDEPAAQALSEAAEMSDGWHDPVNAGRRNAKTLAADHAARKAGAARGTAALKKCGEESAPAPANPKTETVPAPVINKVFLFGNLCRDPDFRKTPGGNDVADVVVAVNETWTDGQGKQRERATFVDVMCWGLSAQIVGKCHKGDAPIIEGRLILDGWQDAKGNKHNKLKVVAEVLAPTARAA